MREKIVNAIKEVMGTNDVDESLLKNGNFNDIGINSIVFIQIVVRLESIFDIEIDSDHLITDNYKTVFDFIDYIEDLIKIEKEK